MVGNLALVTDGLKAYAVFAQVNKAFLRATGGRAGVAAWALVHGIHDKTKQALTLVLRLASMGEDVTPHLPLIASQIDDKDWEVRCMAVRAAVVHALRALSKHAAPNPCFERRDDLGWRQTAARAGAADRLHEAPDQPPGAPALKPPTKIRDRHKFRGDPGRQNKYAPALSISPASEGRAH